MPNLDPDAVTVRRDLRLIARKDLAFLKEDTGQAAGVEHLETQGLVRRSGSRVGGLAIRKAVYANRTEWEPAALCDFCGELIPQAAGGHYEWLTDDLGAASEVFLTHADCSEPFRRMVRIVNADLPWEPAGQAAGDGAGVLRWERSSLHDLARSLGRNMGQNLRHTF